MKTVFSIFSIKTFQPVYTVWHTKLFMVKSSKQAQKIKPIIHKSNNAAYVHQEWRETDFLFFLVGCLYSIFNNVYYFWTVCYILIGK